MSVSRKILLLVLPLIFASVLHAVTWTTIDVPGAIATQALGINSAGDVVGQYTDTNNQTHGFLQSGGIFTTIDMPGFEQTVASGINDSGVICGYATSGNLIAGFTFDGQNFTTLQFPGVHQTAANGIDNAGDVVGWYGSSGSSHLVFRGFKWVNGNFSTIIADRDLTILTGINNLGYVSGFNPIALNGYALSPHGNLFGFSVWTASGINDNNVAIGHVDNQTFGFAYVISNKTFIQVRFPGATDTVPSGINNADLIVGYYTDSTSKQHGFLRNP